MMYRSTSNKVTRRCCQGRQWLSVNLEHTALTNTLMHCDKNHGIVPCFTKLQKHKKLFKYVGQQIFYQLKKTLAPAKLRSAGGPVRPPALLP
jgi:hypothetical protein